MKSRVRGIEAQKANIQAAKAVARPVALTEHGSRAHRMGDRGWAVALSDCRGGAQVGWI